MSASRLSPWTLITIFTTTLACAGGEGESDESATTNAATGSTAATASTSTGGTDTSGSGTEGTDSGSTSASTTAGTTTAGTTTSSSATTTETGSTTATSTSDSDSGGGFNFCGEVCDADDDCTIDGVDQGLSCDNGTCVGEVFGQCSDDMECKILYSGWAQGQPCNAQADCAITQGCINLEGEGHCVYIPSEFIECSTLNMEEVQMPAIEGGTITVCGNTSAICTKDKYCLDGCKSDLDCLSPNYPVCNAGTGICECGQDADCASQPGASVCDQGICRCGSDADCRELDYADVCNEGVCGCSGEAVCDGYPPVFDGTEVACKKF
ncbi:MAG: hypothetical protein R3B09_17665 [Nannocystaceae bacterium]